MNFKIKRYIYYIFYKMSEVKLDTFEGVDKNDEIKKDYIKPQNRNYESYVNFLPDEIFDNPEICKCYTKSGDKCIYPYVRKLGFCGRHSKFINYQDILLSGYAPCSKCGIPNEEIDDKIIWKNICRNLGKRCKNCRDNVRDKYHEKEENDSELIDKNSDTYDKTKFKMCEGCTFNRYPQEISLFKSLKNGKETVRCRKCLDKENKYEQKKRTEVKSINNLLNLGNITNINEVNKQDAG